MVKKAILPLLAFILLLAGFWFFWGDRDIEETKQPSPTQEDPSASDEMESDDSDKGNIIDQVYTLSQKGMILEDETIRAGISSYEDIEKIFGSPESMDETSIGDFAVYPDQHVTIGYQDSIAFDLRSFNTDLHQIHYQELLDQLGEADDIKYYKDDENDQIILIYDLDNDFQLKWILNKPNDQEQNPAVDHISVLAMKLPAESGEGPALTISAQIDRMTMDEKIGQMIFAGIPGTEFNEESGHLVNDYKVGGIIFNGKNIKNPSQTIAYINALKKQNMKNKIPLFLGIDEEGGRVAKLPGITADIPSNLEIGKVNNPSFSYEFGTVLGKMVKAFGFNMDFAPVLDVNSNPNNPVIGDRSFGSSPEIVSDLGLQTMRGIQNEKIIPVIKHFPGHGNTSVDSHLELPLVNKSLEELKKLELIPFQHAIDEGADMVMAAHILLPKIDGKHPSSLSNEVINGILRKQIGFKGVTITDDMTMEAIAGNYDLGDAAVMSVEAGSDIIMVAHDYNKVVKVITALKKAVENGEISEVTIDESVQRILKVKEKYRIADSQIDQIEVNELNQLMQSVLEKYMQ